MSKINRVIRSVVSACCVGVLLYADAHAEDANQQASADAWTFCMKRAKCAIGLANLVYNLCRYTQLIRLGRIQTA